MRFDVCPGRHKRVCEGFGVIATCREDGFDTASGKLTAAHVVRIKSESDVVLAQEAGGARKDFDFGSLCVDLDEGRDAEALRGGFKAHGWDAARGYGNVAVNAANQRRAERTFRAEARISVLVRHGGGNHCDVAQAMPSDVALKDFAVDWVRLKGNNAASRIDSLGK